MLPRMCFVIIIERLFGFLLFRAMTQQSILHLVVNWEVFTTNIWYFLVPLIDQYVVGFRYDSIGGDTTMPGELQARLMLRISVR